MRRTSGMSNEHLVRFFMVKGFTTRPILNRGQCKWRFINSKQPCHVDVFAAIHLTTISNFKVTLNPGQGVQNNGSGNVILPNRKVGDKLMKWVYEERNPIVINGRKIRLFRSKNRPGRGLKETLEKTPYLEPELEEKREEKLRRLDLGLYVDKLQFGIYYRLPDASPTSSRIFSNEYEISYRNKGAGLLWFEYDHKLIRIQVCHNLPHFRVCACFTEALPAGRQDDRRDWSECRHCLL